MLLKKLNDLYRRGFKRYLSTFPQKETKSISGNDLDLQTEKLYYEKSLEHSDYFGVHNLFTVKDLFNAKVHYGHKITSMNDKMKPFLFGSRLGHLIFDLDKTAYHLREALNFIAHIAFRDGVILFISRNPRVSLMVNKTAIECKEFVISRTYKKGFLTDAGFEIRLPDLFILLNTLEPNGTEHPAVVEAAKLCIPTVAIVDTNCNPNLVTYPVPGNDDSPSSVELYCKLFKYAILKGKNKRKEIFGSIPADKMMANNISDSALNEEEEELETDEIIDYVSDSCFSEKDEVELKEKQEQRLELKMKQNIEKKDLKED